MHTNDARDYEIMRDVGAEIRRRRKLTRLSMEQFARRHGLDTSMLSMWERGERLMKVASLERIAEALGCDMLVLFPGYHDHDRRESEPARVRPAWSGGMTDDQVQAAAEAFRVMVIDGRAAERAEMAGLR